MDWRNARQSDNIEDVRDGGGGGMGRALPIGGGLGTLVIGLLVYFFTGNSSILTNSAPPGGNPPITRQQPSSGQNSSAQGGPGSGGVNGGANGGRGDESKQFVAVVLASTEDIWSKFFEQRGQRYEKPKLVLFTNQTRSACGIAESSTGPFYCPRDHKLYLDTQFFDEMRGKLGAPGDFAQAYVIAHEVGHHVQNLMGTMDKVQALQARSDKRESNQLSVRLELQADFYAGVWAHYAQKQKALGVEAGDVEEALGAASAVGDDRLQQQARGYVVPDSFTHGTSAQRVQWFERGLRSGDLQQGNTFGPGFE